MNSAHDPYEHYVSNQLGHVHRDDYPLMSRYYYKNYSRFLCGHQERILDVGCGMGHFLYFLREYDYVNVVGIDLSQECLDYCLEQNLGTPENLYLAGLEDFLAEKQEAFDVIVLNDVIEHFPRERVVPNLRLIKKSLREGGRVIIKVVNSANPITGPASRYIDISHELGFTEESMAQVLRMAGYPRIQIVPQDIWVFNPLVNLAGKVLQGACNGLFRALTLLYGRRTTRIFTKDLIAIGCR